MQASAPFVRRSLAAGLIAMLTVPLVGALRHQTVDHEGATHHIENAHGGHAPVLTESDSGLASARFTTHGTALVAQGLELSLDPSVVITAEVRAHTGHSTRAPPGTPLSRAPPA